MPPTAVSDVKNASSQSVTSLLTQSLTSDSTGCGGDDRQEPSTATACTPEKGEEQQQGGK